MKTLSPDILAAVLLLLEKATTLRTEADQLEAHVRSLVSKDCEVDLETEVWRLDLSQGVLRKDPPSGTDQS